MAPPRRYPAGVRLGALTIAGLCALVLAACGDTVQQKPIPHNILEGLLSAPQPVYWLGGSFRGLQIIEASHDPGGAYSIEYGNCLQGGQGTCVPPLRIISSPDNSFLPGGGAPASRAPIRGASAVLAQGGRTLVIPTADVVVDIYATDRSLASAAAEAMVPINALGVPGGPLPPALPDSGFGEAPLPSQVPSPVHPLG
jgi:hypothetical protein